MDIQPGDTVIYHTNVRSRGYKGGWRKHDIYATVDSVTKSHAWIRYGNVGPNVVIVQPGMGGPYRVPLSKLEKVEERAQA